MAELDTTLDATLDAQFLQAFQPLPAQRPERRWPGPLAVVPRSEFVLGLTTACEVTGTPKGTWTMNDGDNDDIACSGCETRIPVTVELAYSLVQDWCIFIWAGNQEKTPLRSLS